MTSPRQMTVSSPVKSRIAVLCLLVVSCGGGNEITALTEGMSAFTPAAFAGCAKPTQSGYDFIARLGDYTMSTNAWGKDTISNFSLCVKGTTLSATSNGVLQQTGVSGEFAWDFPPQNPSAVFGYPEFLYMPNGKDFQPLPVSGIGNLTLRHDVNVSASGNFNIAYDLFADPQPRTRLEVWPHSVEIMIFVKPWQPSQRSIATLTVNGVVYDFESIVVPYKNTTFKQLNFLARTTVLKSDLPLRPFIDFLVANGHMPASYYLSSVEFGNELGIGTGKMTINSFSVTR